MDCCKVLHEICIGLVENKKFLMVKQLPSLNEDEVLLCVYANNDDVPKLIGKKGVIADSIRRLMSICGTEINKKIMIKFESYE